MDEPRADLTTLAMTVRLSDGSVRRLHSSDATRNAVVALLATAEVSCGEARLNRTTEKAVVVKPGVPLHLVGAVVDAFLREVEAGSSGAHEGPRSGIVFSVAEEGCPGELTLYVYQTARQIVVMR